MANLNRIILVGRLSHDPDLRYTIEGIPMIKFRLAVSRVPRAGTDSFDIIAWQKLAEICGQYLKKGQLILVEGRIQVRTFEGQDGQRRWVTEVVARNVQFMEKNASLITNPEPAEERAAVNEGQGAEAPAVFETEEGLPF